MSNFLKVVFVSLFMMGQALAGDLYYCPMHPHYTSDKPGTCPICGMNLVKRIPKEDSTTGMPTTEKGQAPVKLSAEQFQLMGIKTMVLKPQTLKKIVHAPGYVSTSHELYQLQDEYIQTYLNFVTAYRDAKRYVHTRRNLEPHREIQLKLHETEDKLLRLGLGMPQIEKLQKVSWKTPWNQPELLFFKEGFEYWVVAQIFENDLGFVEVGQEVEVEIPAYLEKTKGVVRSVGGVLDPQTRTVNALIELQGYRGELKGNMLVGVNIMADLNEGIVVPYEAVMDTGIRKIVYVKGMDGVLTPSEIKVSAPGDNGWMVSSGLKEGDEIVVHGNFLLDSESRLQGAIGGSHD